MDTLFPQSLELAIDSPRQETGPFAVVALEQAIDQVLDYSIPKKLMSQIQVGQRVRVPLGRGNKLASGYVVQIRATTAHAKIKPLHDLVDDRVLVSPKLMNLARWMGRYYVAPLGVVLESVIPSAVKKRIGLGYSSIVRWAIERQSLQSFFEKTKAPKRRAILSRLLQLQPDEGIDLIRLAGEADVSPGTVRKLAQLGIITIVQQPDLQGLTDEVLSTADAEPEKMLNAEQQSVFEQIQPRIISSGFSVNLLHGVTGSGKTEIYLQCIRQVVESGRQAIVLVPEIALTPQTVRRFIARFKRVAILHSGLTSTERHRYWQRIAQGQADVIVGARSAVFAPVPNLGMIVVDEEHEPSYKQDSAPRYHGRDVAIKRAQLENVPILLGSATPSLETWWRVTKAPASSIPLPPSPGTPGEGRGEGDLDRRTTIGKQDPPHPTVPELKPERQNNYHLLTLANRVRGLQMPHVELLDMRQENKFRRGVHLLSQRLEHLLRTTIESGHQAILLLNRRGYSNFVYCASCGDALQCKYCDATMTYHRTPGTEVKTARLAAGIHTGQLNCHYCLASNPLPDKCPECGKKLSLFGLGTQRVEEELSRKFPDLKFARVDSDSMRSSKDYEALLGRFASGEIQVMLGTQMIAKGLDYPNVTLVGVISGDTALALPDFRAAERTFQLITQVAGRAGRGDAPGRVVVQTFMPDDPTIRFALKHDYIGFSTTELAQRKSVGLPPFSRLVRIILRDQDQEKLHRLCDDLAAAVTAAVAEVGPGVSVKGPMPCAISRIAGYYRNQLVMMSPSGEKLQLVLAHVRKARALARSDRIAVDVDPTSLL
jgi:primosomal protein N' (replication factor Y)